MNDTAIVPNLGIMASFDPVALDRAAADMVNATEALEGCKLQDKHFNEGDDKFQTLHGKIDWVASLAYAEEIGLGSQEYELVEV